VLAPVALMVAVCIGLAGGREADAGVPAGPPVGPGIPPRVEQRVLEDTAGGKSAQFLVLFAQSPNLSQAYHIMDQDRRGWFVYNTLSESANRSQAGVKALLDRRGIPYQSFWVANALVVSGDRALVDSLAARPEVTRIESDRPFKGISDPVPASQATLPDAPAALEWGVQNVNAPQVWAMGFTGQGIVIGSQDTGVRWSHNAIKAHYRGWNGSVADHNYNWWDAVRTPVPGHTTNPCGYASNVPCDDGGHGTHTTGTTNGDDGSGNQIGVAPGAQWVACRNMDQGDGRPSTYMGCFQFFTAPTDLNGNNPNPALRPHILNNSWGCPPSETCAPDTLQATVEAAQASGMFVAASTGNNGSGCGTVQDPPGIYDATFSAGAIDINNTLAGFSSRGPVMIDGSNRMKPNLAAPGVNVRSALNSSDSAYGNLSGTSMASPHVAGVVALLWSAHPELSRMITETKNLLQNTADPLVVVSPPQTCGGVPSSVIPNNSFGYGRVDALAAVNTAGYTPTPTPTGTPPTATLTRTTTPSPTVTPTFTPGAEPVLHGHVTLQGRPFPPDPRWSVPVTLSLRLGGNPGSELNAVTDDRGYFTVTVATGPGTYAWRVKQAHTLANSGNAAISSGYNDLEMGQLAEGDANSDNCISVADMNLVRASFGSALGSPNFNPNADFNGDNAISVSDFSLMRNNFGHCGAMPISPDQRTGGHDAGSPGY
jgi:serine protease AprX